MKSVVAHSKPRRAIRDAIIAMEATPLACGELALRGYVDEGGTRISHQMSPRVQLELPPFPLVLRTCPDRVISFVAVHRLSRFLPVLSCAYNDDCSLQNHQKTVFPFSSAFFLEPILVFVVPSSGYGTLTPSYPTPSLWPPRSPRSYSGSISNEDWCDLGSDIQTELLN